MNEDFKYHLFYFYPDGSNTGPGNGKEGLGNSDHKPISPPDPIGHENLPHGPENPPVPPHVGQQPKTPAGPGQDKPEHMVQIEINAVNYKFMKGTVFTHEQLVVLAFQTVKPDRTYTVVYRIAGQPSRTLDVTQVLVLEKRTFVNVSCTHKS